MSEVPAVPRFAAPELERALCLLRAGAFGPAVARLDAYLAHEPHSTQAHHLRALALASSGADEAAEEAFRHALQYSPRDAAVLLDLSILLRRCGRLDQALEHAQRAVDAEPELSRGWLELGHTASRAGNQVRAVRALEHAVRLDPTGAPAWQLLGHARRAIGCLDGAIDAFAHAVSLEPGKEAIWVSLGTSLRLAGRVEEALAVYDKAQRAGHSGAVLFDAWVGALLDSGDPNAAIQLATKVARSFPGFTAGLITLAHLLWEYGPDGDGDRAVRMLRAAATAQPRNLELRAALVRWLLASREVEAALAESAAILQMSSHDAMFALHADALAACGKHSEAVAVYAGLDRSGREMGAPFFNAYARHLLRIGDAQQAADVSVRATQADPENQEGWAYLSTCWRLLSDPRESWLCDYEAHIGTVDVDFDLPGAGMHQSRQCLRRTLESLHRAHREPRQQSVRGGTQTSGRLLQRRDPVLAVLRQAFLGAVHGWLVQLPQDPSHPFLRRNRRHARIDGSWSVRLRSSGSHANHIHPEGWISSAYHVSLPVSTVHARSGEQAGFICFGQPPAELGLGLPPKRVIQPVEGRLVLFPSYFWHGTVPFADPDPRLTVAFDMSPGSPDHP